MAVLSVFGSCALISVSQKRIITFTVSFSSLVNSNAHTTPVWIYSEPYAYKFSAVDIFWNITRRHAISPVPKFHHLLGHVFCDSAGDIDFYQMSLSQLESTILHESIIYIYITSYDIKYICPIRVEKETTNRNVMITSRWVDQP